MTRTKAGLAPVRELMSEPQLVAHPDTTLAEIYRGLETHGAEACPVVLPDRTLVGIVTRLDLLRALRPDRDLGVLDVATFGAQRARDIMRCGVVTVEPHDPIVAAADLMIETRLHVLPVVHRGPGQPKLLGVITQRDVLRYLAGAPAESAE
ncbi:MAG TPA: CBS domain-containing protein [Gemmatimonadales bacterium]|jgi:CBS domain-containing protein|nr:CBS domain-containing protein [Gemmatimonadales bacterium]